MRRVSDVCLSLVPGYHAKPVAYDFLWGSARVHHMIIDSLVPNSTIHSKLWDPALELLWNPASTACNFAGAEYNGDNMIHLFQPEGPRGLLVDIERLTAAVTIAANLVSTDSSDDVPVGQWR